MLSDLNQYRAIKNNLEEIIKISGYRIDYVAKKLGISPQNFSVKKQRNSWNDDEIEKILKIVDNEDSEDYILGQIMEVLESDETLSLSEFMKAVKWK
ncbi:MAG: hypothetical protein ABI472_22220 [Ginsengibacter sp.]